jgi:hypothetical protein
MAFLFLAFVPRKHANKIPTSLHHFDVHIHIDRGPSRARACRKEERGMHQMIRITLINHEEDDDGQQPPPQAR